MHIMELAPKLPKIATATFGVDVFTMCPITNEFPLCFRQFWVSADILECGWVGTNGANDTRAGRCCARQCKCAGLAAILSVQWDDLFYFRVKINAWIW